MVALRMACAALMFTALAVFAQADEFSGAVGETPCSKKGYEPSEFKTADAVWWGNKEKTRTPYMEFAKTEIPAPEVDPTFPTIYFDLDKAILKPEGRAIADTLVAYLKSHPGKKAVIEGHCCDWASDGYNMALGKRRAEAVVKYVVESGISADRLTPVSFGEDRPAVVNDSPQRPLNRRAEILIRVE